MARWSIFTPPWRFPTITRVAGITLFFSKRFARTDRLDHSARRVFGDRLPRSSRNGVEFNHSFMELFLRGTHKNNWGPRTAFMMGRSLSRLRHRLSLRLQRELRP